MKYYFVNLAVHILITVLLLVFTVVTTNKNRRGQCKRGFLYFLPMVLSALVAFHLLFFSAPRLLDVADVIDANYYSYTGTIEETGRFNNYLIVDGKVYYVNPIHEYPAAGTTIRLRYLKYSHCVVEVSLVEEVNITDTINEEMQTTIAIDHSSGNS